MTHTSSSFASLGLSTSLLKAVEALNFHTPSAIQEQTIPWLLQGRDVIGQAQTGTGKTAAFALPILQRLQLNNRETQALILAPTRELAIQVAENFTDLGANQMGVKVLVLCGGQDYRPQLKQLRDGAQIVVGTPGRILDHLDRGTLQLGNLSTFILDEADEMLRMGFIEDVETILSKLPNTKQMALFSATMPTRIKQIANSYLNDPISIEIKAATATVQTIEQRFLFANQTQKPDALLRVLACEEAQGVIVFVCTKSSTEVVAELLQQNGHKAMAIHGDLSQALRERIISQFKQGGVDILVATDVAARGLDVDRVTHVINYDIAQDCETYVHRIGRTGRAGRSGVTILFVTPKESRMLNMIERHTRQRIEKITVPNDHAIIAAKQKQFINNITERLGHEHLGEYQQMIEAFLQENKVSVIELAAALALKLNSDKPWKNSLGFDRVPQPERERKGRRGEERQSRPFERERGRRNKVEEHAQELFRLDVGRIHGVKPGNIVGAIANEAGIQGRYITGLKINEDHSIVKLPKGMPKEIFQGLNKTWVCGRQLRLVSLG